MERAAHRGPDPILRFRHTQPLRQIGDKAPPNESALKELDELMIEQVKEQKKELGIGSNTTGVADAGYFTENAIIDNKDDEDFPIVVSPSVEGGVGYKE